MKKPITVVLLVILISILCCPSCLAQSVGNEELIGTWILKEIKGFTNDPDALAMRDMLDGGAVVVYTYEKKGAMIQYMYADDVLNQVDDSYYMDETGIHVRSADTSVPFKIEDNELTLFQEKGEIVFTRVDDITSLPFIINADESTLEGNWKLVSAVGEGANVILESLMTGAVHAYYFQNGMLFHSITENGEENIYYRGQYKVRANTLYLDDAYFAYFSIQDSNLYLYNDDTRMMLSKME